jgi:hypothetical protein
MQDAFEKLSKRLQKRSPIDVDGTPFTVWLIEIRDLHTHDGPAVAVIVGAKSDSETHTGELRVGRQRLEDLDDLENAIIEVMKRIINADLPPGARELL